ncbi:nose resistant to fluoxetine protein 6-like [Eupeodes corollae]|uniref:nose resistant to fluoxetine protein 6-like n=1 Tax=Eupeodes corollae TaxID=290404 RepID=UPI0024933918|nr:nose resistant to fluoxetine protein 6-like [Eupeodes corollae]
MVRFFEFNDKGWNISEKCLKDTYNYLEGLRKGSIWAIKLYDATSYYGGGAYGGNMFRIYNPELCRNLQSEYMDMVGKHWNVRFNTTVVPFSVVIIVATYTIEMMNSNFYQSIEIQQMVCLPKSCKDPDLLQLLDVFMFQSNQIVKNISFIKHRIVKEDFYILQDAGFLTIIIVIGLSLVTFLISHFSKCWPMWDKSEESISESNNFNINLKTLEEYEKLRKNINLNVHQFDDRGRINRATFTQKPTVQNPIVATNIETNRHINETDKINFIQILNKAISFRNIAFELLKRENDSQQSMRGVMAILTIVLIYINTCSEINFISNNRNDFLGDTTSFQTFIQNHATYLFDVYFFISGSFLTYEFFKKIPHGSWNVFEQLVHLMTMFADKFLSGSVSYAIVLIALEVTSKYFHFNTVLEVPSYDFQACETNKWKNILYLDTFLPLEQRCMPWTWFISVQVHFFVAGCLVLLLARIHPKYAVIICSVLFLTSLAASTYLEIKQYSKPYSIKTLKKDDLITFNLIYDQVSLRIPLYILGMCLGYILHKTNGKIRINVIIFIFGWIACLLIISFFLFGYQFILFRSTPVARACLIISGHIMWIMIIFWIIIASTTQYGAFLRKLFSHHFINVIGKLSNTPLIVAPFVIRTFVLAGEIPFNANKGIMFTMFIGFSIITYLCSLVLFILLDSRIKEIWSVLSMRYL